MRPRDDQLLPLKAVSNQREIKYETYEQDFLFTFQKNGTGVCRDIDYGAEISFSWQSGEAPQEDGPELTAFLRDLAEELFWSEINDQLGEDAVLGDSDWSESSEDIEFTCGSQQELENLTRMVLYSFPSIWSDASEQRAITFSAQGQNSGEEAGLGEDPDNLELGDDLTPADRVRVVELLNFAISQNTPVGEELEYNDGPSNRKSGYTWYAKSVSVDVSRPSYHEMAEARSQLRQQLKISLSAADLRRLLPLQ
jgi:hypothetical protein